MKNIIKKKYLRGGILCFALLLSASSLFAEEKITLKCNGKMQTITKDQFYIYNKPLKDQLLADGYNGIYGQDIYYKGDNFVKRIKDVLNQNPNIKDICASNPHEEFIDNANHVLTSKFIHSIELINNAYTYHFFMTTHSEEDFNDYFKTKKIKYPYNYAIKPKFETAMLVKTLNKDYYLCKVYDGQSFLIESKYIPEESVNVRFTEWDDTKQDGTKVRINKVIIRGISNLPTKNEVGYFSTNTFIIEKDVLAEQNGGYKVFNYQGTLELESEEGFLPILKPYKDGKYNILIEKN
jgi:hypothetical protein